MGTIRIIRAGTTVQRNFRGFRRGMTLIELVVALTLSVLLVTATGGVIKSMMQKKKVFADRLEVQPWRLELAARLRDDLIQSQEIRIGSKSLELYGFCGHDMETGEPTQVPVHVVWLLSKENGYSILTRTEKLRGGVEELSITPRVELMALGISSISMGAFLGREQEEKNELLTVTDMERQNKEPGDWTTIPDGYTVIVGGLNRQNLENGRTGIPFLDKIPIIKYLASIEDDKKSHTSLFVFLKPIILRDDKFQDLKYLSDQDARSAQIRTTLPQSRPLIME